MSKIFELYLIIFLSSPLNLAIAEVPFHSGCNPPKWNAPAESTDGVFTGDLTLECWVAGGVKWQPKVASLRQNMIEKIRAESEIHEGPISLKAGYLPTLKWDASHNFAEDGNSVHIREIILLSAPSENEIKYETASKQVEATGMAGYLRSVQFSMQISKKPELVQISFRNQVQVKRPWYALDLIFAPIARKVCFDKMEKVKEKFLPWLLPLLQKQP